MWLLVAVAVAALAVWAVLTAQRLNRLHIRLDRSRDALQAALDRRCAVIAATLPAAAGAARATEEVRLSDRDLRSRLDKEDALAAEVAVHRAATGGDGADSAAERELRDADTRVMLALRFYNDAVADTRALRLRPLVRTLRLGGTAALPEYAALGQLPAGPGAAE
ncbi:hypothetical protein JKI95_11890 [Corynebacterium aquatimens]|uniref:hypothetical protein n=1 Tax=Corynebacterium TaxID=1716 RepID=UPI001F2829C6|nr:MULTISPECIES: hypothetical protein [Corynebacterium]QYH20578.1 hypothetical protein JKI95_11890 [Corynebacterium aquatimens]UIZ93359.1 hypothetical protein JZY91_06095 [Corynebacterium sp. CNCTC7651]